jgi:ABC-2 type transport system permease protein
VIAALFVLTPNALVYESLIATPVILLAGIFGYPDALGAFSDAARILPLRSAVDAIESAAVGDGDFWANALAAFAVSVLWIAGAALASSVATRRALRDGTLDLV